MFRVRMVRNCNKFAMAENTKEQTCNFLCSLCSNVPCGNTVSAFNCDHIFLMWLSTSEHKKMVIVVSSQARTEETILKIPFCLHWQTVLLPIPWSYYQLFSCMPFMLICCICSVYLHRHTCTNMYMLVCVHIQAKFLDI